MAGTIVFTGANGSLGLYAVEHLLTKYPEHTALLTVRNATDADPNTRKLRDMIARFPNAKASVYQVDLSRLSDVHKFATVVAEQVESNKLPRIIGIVCNAFYWNLVGGPDMTVDGYEKSFAVSHIAHVALVLRLIGSFSPDGGRVTLLSSDAHYPGKNPTEKIPPVIPEDLDLLPKPSATKGDVFGLGYQRYANSKLALTAWMYALNRRLEKDSNLRNITAIALHPGSLVDSRSLRTNAPGYLGIAQTLVLRPFLPILRRRDPTFRKARDAGVDTMELTLGKIRPGERGYFVCRDPDESAPQSRNAEVQEKLWAKSAEWAGITEEKTALKLGS